MTKKTNIFMWAALLLLVAGCATTYTPVVDTKGLDQQKFQQDMAECRMLADQVNVTEDGVTDGLIGAGFGAAAGAALGALSGNAGMGAATGSVVGAFGAGGTGAVSAAQRQKTIMNNCLTGRGYKILG
jgi:hypothetical protein